jgi:hypothetical protein
VANDSEHVIRCTKCFGRDVRPSRRGTFLDSIMERLRRTPFRCRSCQHRFYVYIPRERDDLADIETLETEAPPDDEATSNKDVAKPAEP